MRLKYALTAMRAPESLRMYARTGDLPGGKGASFSRKSPCSREIIADT